MLKRKETVWHDSINMNHIFFFVFFCFVFCFAFSCIPGRRQRFLRPPFAVTHRSRLKGSRTCDFSVQIFLFLFFSFLSLRLWFDFLFVFLFFILFFPFLSLINSVCIDMWKEMYDRNAFCLHQASKRNVLASLSNNALVKERLLRFTTVDMSQNAGMGQGSKGRQHEYHHIFFHPSRVDTTKLAEQVTLLLLFRMTSQLLVGNRKGAMGQFERCMVGTFLGCRLALIGRGKREGWECGGQS